ncbi:MAG: cysteine--tRNA ligase [Deltaproteobacteria bacterium]|nr:cysteine--tRNA ligase [Deltaproteobacteria bacterium]
MTMKIYRNIVETIGNTPLVEIGKINPNRNVTVLAKLEYFNPGGSIKDRTALSMIEGAEARGELTKDKIIVEATSGNTGIGLAMVAASKGYRVLLAMSESASEERKRILKALGAELHFTPANLGTDGAIEFVYELYRMHPDKYYIADQFNSEDNILAHYRGTAEEIWRQTDGLVTMVVATLGTSGTAMGIARRLKECSESVRIVGVEPYMRHKIQGLKNMKESYQPGIFDRKRLDETVNIHDDDAFRMARRLAREEGIFAGMSSGAAVHVALEKAKEMDSGVVVAILSDGGDRYLSTDLFRDEEAASLTLFNAFTRSKESFRPARKEEVLIYSCGPTVHEIPHVGVYRRFVVADMIVRYLAFKGYRVKHRSNVIDLSDRSIRGSEEAGQTVSAFTETAIEGFLSGVRKLNIRAETLFPRATEAIDDMIASVDKLVGHGYAYEKLRSVYFDISKLDDYGVLSKTDLDGAGTANRVTLDDHEKDSPADFALLKRSTLAELKKGIYYKTKWGNVRPTWHLECAATAMKNLGEAIDIHVGGADILFPHCENVRAIGKALTGKAPANYWLNSELVMLDGQKMSRALNNCYSIDNLEERGYNGAVVRYFFLSSHYRKPLNFSFGALDTAKNTIRRINDFIQDLLRLSPGPGCPEADQMIYDLSQGFIESMDDDFNASGALAALFDFVKRVSDPLREGRLSEKDRARIVELLHKIDSVLAFMDFEELKLPPEAESLVEEREELRERGRWAEADALRERLNAMGFVIQDTKEGSRWKRS